MSLQPSGSAIARFLLVILPARTSWVTHEAEELNAPSRPLASPGVHMEEGLSEQCFIVEDHRSRRHRTGLWGWGRWLWVWSSLEAQSVCTSHLLDPLLQSLLILQGRPRASSPRSLRSVPPGMCGPDWEAPEILVRHWGCRLASGLPSSQSSVPPAGLVFSSPLSLPSLGCSWHLLGQC